MSIFIAEMHGVV